MSYSSVSYSANSAANSGKDYTYPFPAVTHDTDNILVLVGGTSLAITRYTVASSGGTITLEAAPGAGTAPLDVALSASNVLKVYRFTNRTSPEVVFSSTAIIQDEDLNNATDQVRYLALEAVDRANEGMTIDESDASRYNVQIDGVDKRIFGIATPTNDKDAVNKAYADANVSLAAGSATAAAGSATTAAADAVSTAADVVLTNADVVLAEADKVQTGLDRVAVAADLVATNQDTIDTAADVVLAEADKVQTGLDRVATAADKVATNADVVLTAADELLTRADTVLTAADVVSSAASAAAAAASFDSFDDRYLGAKSTDPTVDNDGATLLDGALYFNSVANNMRVYDLGTTTWIVVASSLPQGLAASDSPTFTQIKLTGGSPGVDKVLTSDADGDATWEVNASPPILTSLDYPGDDTALDTVGEFNLTGSTTVSGDATITVSSTTALKQGMLVTGTGIPTGADRTVLSITDGTHFELSVNADVSGTATLTFNTQTLVITGSNFTSTITSVTSAGTTPSTVTRDSSTQITVSGFPAKAVGTYADALGLVVTNSTGLAGNINVDYSPLPGWTSPASGNLLDDYTGTITEIDLVGGADTDSYVITTGALPAGLAMNSTTGNLTGNMTTGAATYNFTVDAIDAQAQSSPRLFNIISKGALPDPTGGSGAGGSGSPYTFTGDGTTGTSGQAYRVHEFWYSGTADFLNHTFQTYSNLTDIVEYLVIAGGGSGGIYSPSSGGSGYHVGNSGNTSSIANSGTLIASAGGGYGGCYPSVSGGLGGSGGGGGGASGNGGALTTDEGYDGSDAGGGSGPGGTYGGGGGGGSGGTTDSEVGGSGTSSYITGTSVPRGGGGGQSSTGYNGNSLGGAGGGGQGGNGTTSATPGVQGEDGTGSGGGADDDGSGAGSGGGGAGGYRSAVYVGLTGETSGGGSTARTKLTFNTGSYTIRVGAGGASVGSASDALSGRGGHGIVILRYPI